MVTAILNAILAKRIVLDDIITVNDIRDWVRMLDSAELSDSNHPDIISKFAKKFGHCPIEMPQEEIDCIQKRVSTYAEKEKRNEINQIVKKSKKRKWYPEQMNMNIESEEMSRMKKKIDYYIMNALSTSTDGKRRFNENTFEWLSDKLESLHHQMSRSIADPNGFLLEDIAIIPVEPLEFEYMENLHSIAMMKELSFLAPNTFLTSCWWKIPRQ